MRVLFRPRAAAAVVVLLAVSVIFSVQAQETNLVVNGGFESGFASLAGTAPRNVATGWTPWNAPRTSGMASFENVSPKYIAASTATTNGVIPRIRSGSDAQIYYAFYETFDGGIYQQISGLTPGTELRFSVYSYIWSTTYDDPNVSEDPGSVAFRIGIDPTGGTDALSRNVVYSTPTVTYDAYRQASVIARAQGSTVTVFIRASIGDPVQYTYLYLDDAVLSPTTLTPAATATTLPATNTAIPSTATRLPATNTSIPPTATRPPSTSTPVSGVTNTLIPNTVIPTSTTVAAATVVPPSTGVPSLPTPTQESDALLPTATPFGLDATATAFAGGGTPVPTQVGQPQATIVAVSPVPSATPNLNVLNPFPARLVHTVRRGDTVFDLARLYGSSVEAILVANGLQNNGFISINQALVIPVLIAVPSTPVPAPTASAAQPNNTPSPVVTAPPSGTAIYQVGRGDTLASISARFNTTVGAIVQLNGITNPNLIFVGQRLLVPSTGLPDQIAPAPVNPVGSYVVQPGDTLFRISLRFGRSMQAIATVNNIVNFNRIFVGQSLVIP